MSNGEITTDLSLPTLAPAPSVRSVSEHRPNQDADSRSRRRSPAEKGSEDELSPLTSEETEHQIDRMA